MGLLSFWLTRNQPQRGCPVSMSVFCPSARHDCERRVVPRVPLLRRGTGAHGCPSSRDRRMSEVTLDVFGVCTLVDQWCLAGVSEIMHAKAIGESSFANGRLPDTSSEVAVPERLSGPASLGTLPSGHLLRQRPTAIGSHGPHYRRVTRRAVRYAPMVSADPTTIPASPALQRHKPTRRIPRTTRR